MEHIIIDLHSEKAELKGYIFRILEEHVRVGNSTPGMVHFGFTFDQDGWVIAYLDTRPNAGRDGEWTTHIALEMRLARPLWHEAAGLSDLHGLILIGTDGKEINDLNEHPTPEAFAEILGNFIRSSIADFVSEGVFKILGSGQLQYCVEELTGLYGWPLDPEYLKIVELAKIESAAFDSRSHIVRGR